MARNRDYAPVGNTCPMIDEVISAIESVDWSENTFHTAQSVSEIMEKIRSANLELRNWGNDEFKRAEELEKDLDYANREIEQLKDVIENIEA